MADLLLLLNNADGVDWSFSGGALLRQTSFARASSAQNFNASGVLASAGVDVPRFDYDPATLASKGLLIEAQNTNLLLYSSSPGGTNWFNVGQTVTQNAATSPDGRMDAALVTVTTNVVNQGLMGQSLELDAETYTASVYLKAGTQSTYCIQPHGDPGGVQVMFDLDAQTTQLLAQYGTGYAFISSGIMPVNNGWYRCWATFAFSSNDNAVVLWFGNAMPSEAGTLYIYGAQLESGAFPTSLVSTTATPATRAADALSFVVPNGVGKLRYVFDNASTQDIGVTAGVYTVPTNLNRAWIKRIYSL